MKIQRALFCVLLLCWLFPGPLYAYIDPGTGSQIIQILIAGVLGGAFAIKCWWQNIKTYFRAKFLPSKESQTDKSEEGKK